MLSFQIRLFPYFKTRNLGLLFFWSNKAHFYQYANVVIVLYLLVVWVLIRDSEPPKPVIPFSVSTQNMLVLYQKVWLLYQKKISSTLYPRGIMPKRVTSGGLISAASRLGNTETSQRWRVLTLSDFSVLGIEFKTFLRGY